MEVEEIDPSDILCTLVIIITENREWDISKFCTSLPLYIQNQIYNVQLPADPTSLDAIKWKETSMESQRHVLFLNFSHTTRTLKILLPGCGYGKLIVLKNSVFCMAPHAWVIAMNDYRYCIGATKSNMCDRCEVQPETILHVLCDCPKSRKVCDELVLSSKCQWFYYLPLDVWVKTNIDVNNAIASLV